MKFLKKLQIDYSNPYKYLVGICLCIVCLVYGCKPTAESAFPGYISIQEAKLILYKDTLINALPDVWALQGNDYIGTFQLPVNIPFLNRDRSTYFFRAGVWRNANPERRVIYPFIRIDTLFAQMRPNEQIDYKPHFRYFEDTLLRFPFVENFESERINFNINTLNFRDTVLIRRNTSSDAPQGASFGTALFDDKKATLGLVSANEFTLPQRQVWAEVTYKGTQKFEIGLWAKGESIPQSLIMPAAPQSNDRWQTVFIDLYPQVVAYPQGTPFRLFIYSVGNGKPQSLNFDAIRIIHFR